MLPLTDAERCGMLSPEGGSGGRGLSFRFPGISQEFPKTTASKMVSQIVEVSTKIRGQKTCVNRLRKWL